jgi:hypothetical protein
MALLAATPLPLSGFAHEAQQVRRAWHKRAAAQAVVRAMRSHG